jgi:hypothetical protein
LLTTIARFSELAHKRDQPAYLRQRHCPEPTKKS